MSQDLSDVLEHLWEPEVEQHTETQSKFRQIHNLPVWQQNYNRLNELASLFSHLRDADFSTNVIGLEMLKVETRVFLIKGWRILVHFHNDISMLQWCWYRSARCSFEILRRFAKLKENYSTFTGLCVIFPPCVWLPCNRISSYSFSEVKFSSPVLLSQTLLKKTFKNITFNMKFIFYWHAHISILQAYIGCGFGLLILKNIQNTIVAFAVGCSVFLPCLVMKWHGAILFISLLLDCRMTIQLILCHYEHNM